METSITPAFIVNPCSASCTIDCNEVYVPFRRNALQIAEYLFVHALEDADFREPVLRLRLLLLSLRRETNRASHAAIPSEKDLLALSLPVLILVLIRKNVFCGADDELRRQNIACRSVLSI